MEVNKTNGQHHNPFRNSSDQYRQTKAVLRWTNWKIEKYPGPMEYWMIQTAPTDDKGMPLRPGVNGGMTKKEHPNQKPVNYISVESIDESIKKAKKIGGKIVTPKQQVPNVGWIATTTDPEGNHIALLQPQRR